MDHSSALADSTCQPVNTIDTVATTPNKTTAVQLLGIKKSFKNVKAVNGITLEINSGEIVAIIGHNGAGKTTTIDIALGLIKPDHGDAELFGMPPAEAIKRGLVSAIMQSDSLITETSVERLLKLIASTYQNPMPLAEVMERTNITKIKNRIIGKCSGGEIQRVRLALALVGRPRLIILDEPTSGLDPIARQEFWAVMKAEAKQGKTIIFATHYLEEAQNYAARTVMLSHGKIVADGPTAQLRALADQQHFTASIPHAQLDVFKAQIRDKFPHINVSWDDNQLRANGTHLNELAAFTVVTPGVVGAELTNASLDEAFAKLTD